MSNEHFGYDELVKKNFKTKDVGIDTHPDFSLYHIDEIREEMSKCIPLRGDFDHEKSY
jgi:hypothetical protein